MPAYMLFNINCLIPEITLTIMMMVLLMVGIFMRKVTAFQVTFLAIVTLAISSFLALQYGNMSILIFSNSLHVTKFTQACKAVVYLCNLIFLIVSLNQQAKIKIETPILNLLISLGMSILISSNTLLTFYLGLELFSLGLYVIIADNKGSNKSTEASLKYFILGAISTGLFLFGSSLVYGFLGTINFQEISYIYQVNFCSTCAVQQNMIVLVGFILILISSLFKLSVVPFHNWTPDVYEGSSSNVLLMLTSSAKLASLAIFMRLLNELFHPIRDQIHIILLYLAAASLLIGNIAAVKQQNIKRLMAFSTIGHIGFILLSFLSYHNDNAVNTLFYMLTYLSLTLTFFTILGALSRYKSFSDQILDLAALNKDNKLLSAALACVLFSLAGIPPLAGFWAKLYIIVPLVENKIYHMAGIAILATLIGAFYYLNLIRIIYFEDKGTKQDKVKLYKSEIIIIGIGIIFNICYIFVPSQTAEYIRTLFNV
jgi:NADH-quinone oxidoreductase subunit N